MDTENDAFRKLVVDTVTFTIEKLTAQEHDQPDAAVRVAAMRKLATAIEREIWKLHPRQV